MKRIAFVFTVLLFAAQSVVADDTASTENRQNLTLAAADIAHQDRWSNQARKPQTQAQAPAADFSAQISAMNERINAQLEERLMDRGVMEFEVNF
ncbi:hypothetical protein [Marinimicrobium alkaliphilum]|uniref:hypothetical protein n=1 Tax=Marinimicrobium alkaliphilum TaxID=2202654 RepID=UPI000DB98CF7|nr:hypothetical protein [Marinimicrobium alkaliphilum]